MNNIQNNNSNSNNDHDCQCNNKDDKNHAYSTYSNNKIDETDRVTFEMLTLTEWFYAAGS